MSIIVSAKHTRGPGRRIRAGERSVLVIGRTGETFTYQEDLTASDGSTLLTHATYTWLPDYLDSPDNTYCFVKLTQKRTEAYDSQTVFSQEDYTYSNTHGGVLTAISSGTDAENVTTTNTYANYGDWIWRKTQETVTGASTGQVRQTTFGYESSTGNLLSKTFWNDQGTGDPQVGMTYDTYGNLSTETDARGNTTTYEYETTAYTFPSRITYPSTSGVSHAVENTLWDYRFGKAAQTKDENGNLTDYGYDEFGRIESVDYPDGGQTLTAYYDNVFPRYKITRVLEATPSDYIDKYEYADGFGRPIQQISFGENSQAIASRQYYDTMGRQYLTQGPFFASGAGYPQAVPTEYPWSQTTFDERNRPTQIQTPDDEQTSPVSTTYSYSGLSTTITDPDGGMKKETRDYLDRIREVVEYGESQDPFTTTYTYNAAGDLLTVTDALANVTTINHDSLGNKINMTDPDMGYWVYTYDPNGNLHTQTDAKGQEIEFEYDELNRVTSKTYSTSGESPVKYSYDTYWGVPVANGIGRLTSVSTRDPSDPSAIESETKYDTYDTMGRETMVTKTIIGAPSTYTTAYAYGRAGQMEQIAYPDGFSLDYAYHAGSGLLQTATGSDSVVYATVTGYEPTGKMGQIDYGNGVVTSFAYYPQNTRLDTIWTEDGSSNLLQSRAYHYLPSGDIQQIDDGRTLANYAYTYDPLHRLTSETATGAVQTFTNHVLDFDHSAAGPVHAADGVTANGEVFTYAYDANGNMISGWDFSDPLNPATRTIDYNADNMPKTVTHSANGTTTLVYDGESQRVKKTAGGSDTYYVNKYFEVEGTSEIKYVFAGNQRIARIATAGTRYFHQDHLGSATLVTDASGAQVEGSEYLPFGGERSHNGTVQAPYKFTDQELDDSTGFYNYDARLYDSGSGRFSSADSLVQFPFGPQSLNRYSYVFNNPLRYTDPTGHMGDGAALAAAEAGRDMANSDSQGGQTLSKGDSGRISLGTISVQAKRPRSEGNNGYSAAAVATIGIRNLHPALRYGPVVIAIGVEALKAIDRFYSKDEDDEAEESLEVDASKTSPTIDPNEFAGKTPAEIDALAKEKGLIPQGTDPMNGQGSYVDPLTGEQRVLSHPNSDSPHMHVNDPYGGRVDINGNSVPQESPSAHLPIGDQQ